MRILTERTDAVEYLERKLQDVASIRGDRRLSWLVRRKKLIRRVITTALGVVPELPPGANQKDQDEFVETIQFDTWNSLRGQNLAFGVELDPDVVAKWQYHAQRAIDTAASVIANEYLATVQTLRTARECEYDAVARTKHMGPKISPKR